MSHRSALFAAALLYLAAAGAQEPAAPAPEAAPGTATQQAGDEEPLTAPTAATKATGPSPDTFKPSEEISEDLSVSFPVDI